MLESLKDQLLLVFRNADAGVGHRNGNGPIGGFQHRMIGAPPAMGAMDIQRHAALRRELEGVGQQIEHNLLQPLLVGANGRW